VLRYRAKLDQFPVFAREGYALPLGRAVQHTGEIDATHPVEMLWVFGKPASALTGFAQLHIDAAGGDAFTVRVMPGLKTELWGDATDIAVASL
jgi:alpha-glucosidase (family GH31 glycosyl hydrolase)